MRHIDAHLRRYNKYTLLARRTNTSHRQLHLNSTLYNSAFCVHVCVHVCVLASIVKCFCRKFDAFYDTQRANKQTSKRANECFLGDSKTRQSHAWTDTISVTPNTNRHMYDNMGVCVCVNGRLVGWCRRLK